MVNLAMNTGIAPEVWNPALRDDPRVVDTALDILAAQAREMERARARGRGR